MIIELGRVSEETKKAVNPPLDSFVQPIRT